MKRTEKRQLDRQYNRITELLPYVYKSPVVHRLTRKQKQKIQQAVKDAMYERTAIVLPEVYE